MHLMVYIVECLALCLSMPIICSCDCHDVLTAMFGLLPCLEMYDRVFTC